ncbi:hypothetical protein CAP39_05420 [Sphingomonas sp. IBVSS1]|nr:hypothetical protein CAP39_05420 [Sphingomonas sp. IBVSS1]
MIPQPDDGLYWLERLSGFRREEREVAGKTVLFIIEANALGCVHPCSVSDVVWMLESLHASEWSGLRTVVFRQPTRKQLVLRPAWGRLSYHAELNSAKGQIVAKGPVLFLDAIMPGQSLTWSTRLDPDDARELERLRHDGHDIARSGRQHVITITPASARNTQLYRTLLHEIGHWFDWLSKVEEPAMRGQDRGELENTYFARPRSERDAFAHRYADQCRARMIDSGFIPFEPRH